MPLVSPTADYTLPAGQTLSGSDQPAVYVFKAPPGSWPSLEIDGAISVTITDTSTFFPDAIVFDGGAQAGGSLVIGASAIITVAADHAAGVYAHATGVYGGSFSPDIVNRGHIAVSAIDAAFGVTVFDNTHRVENDGIISVTSPHSARAVWMENHSDFTNTGTITATGGDQSTMGLEAYRFDADVTNSGTITATNTAHNTIAVLLETWTSAHTFTNSGTVQGDTALSMSNAGYAVVDHVVNSGTLIGKVDLGNGQTVLNNSGHIQGAVNLGDGNDTYVGAGGTLDTALHGGAGDDNISGGAAGEAFFGDAGNDTISGGGGDDTLDGGAGSNAIDGGAGVDTLSYAASATAVTVDLQAGTVSRPDGQDTISGVESVVGSPLGDTLRLGSASGTVMAGSGDDSISALGGQNYLRGEAGDDSISGGSGFDDANGNMGNDTIHGNGGDDYSVGGKDNDVLFGDAGNDIVWGNLGNDTCDGGDGNDQVRGGQGDDSVSGGAGDDFVSGDRGNDTISGGAGADLFHGSQDAGIDRVIDFSVAEGDRVMLDPGTTYTLSQVGADTVLDMGGGNQMILVGVQASTLPAGAIFLG